MIWLALWGASGFALWVVVVWTDPPRRWRSESRDDGWATVLGFYLPLLVGVGPLGWAAFIAARVLHPDDRPGGA